MHERATLAIWFLLNIVGMLLTMFMPKIISDTSRKRTGLSHLARIASYEKLEEKGVPIVYGDKAA